MKSFLFAFVFGLALSGSAQTPGPVPFKIQLLSGYRHRALPGIDTLVGEIYKPHGLRIQYDVDTLPTAHPRKVAPTVEWKRQCLWITDDNASAPIADNEITCWVDIDEHPRIETLHVNFPDGTSFWGRVKNKRQISEMLTMVLTYDPSQ